MRKFSWILIWALVMIGCGNKQQSLPIVNLDEVCINPIVDFKKTDEIKPGQFNHLNLSKSQFLEVLDTNLKASRCFRETAQNKYKLKALYGSINQQKQTDGFVRKESEDLSIIEVQIAFSKANEIRIFTGKSTIESQMTQYFNLGDAASITQEQIQIALQNAVRSAINEAIKSFQTTPSP